MAAGRIAEPESASRPMSASALQFCAGRRALLLEDSDSARRHGARIYGEILGGEVNCGGQRNGGSITASNPEWAQRYIRRVLADAVDVILERCAGEPVSEVRAASYGKSPSLLRGKMGFRNNYL